LYHDNEKIVIRNYEGKIFEYPETGGDQTVQFAPQREWSRREPSDIDGRAERPKRAGASESISRRVSVFVMWRAPRCRRPDVWDTTARVPPKRSILAARLNSPAPRVEPPHSFAARSAPSRAPRRFGVMLNTF
jgi:hypothetical protein